MRFLFFFASLSLLLFLYLGCENIKFDKEPEWNGLLHDVCGDCRPDDGYIFLFLDNVCSVCLRGDFLDLKEKISQSSKVVIVLSTDRKKYEEDYSFKTYYVPLEQIQRSGVSQVTSMVFMYNRGKLVYGKPIRSDDINKLIRRL